MVRFNPRPREGATTGFNPLFQVFVCFNPRPREGATTVAGIRAGIDAVSIHAPVKGRPIQPGSLR